MKPCYKEWPWYENARDERKDSRNVLGLKTGSRSSKGRVGGQRCDDARVPKPGQTLVAKLQSVQFVTHFQKWKYPRRFIGHAC